MPPLVVNCIPTVKLASPLKITIPLLGEIKMAIEAIHGIPDPLELLIKFQNTISTLLAPVRFYLELCAVQAAFYKCMLALPKAILTMNPQPVFDCLTNLFKVIAKVLSNIPPISYIKTFMDIASQVIDLIDAIVTFFSVLDQKITAYIVVFTEAELLGDLELISFVNCGLTETKSSVLTLLDMLELVKPCIDVLLNVFLSMIPTPPLQVVAQDMLDVSNTLTLVKDQITNHTGTLVPIPALGTLLDAMNKMRSAMVLAYNVIAPLIGETPDKVTREMPSFVNF